MTKKTMEKTDIKSVSKFYRNVKLRSDPNNEFDIVSLLRIKDKDKYYTDSLFENGKGRSLIKKHGIGFARVENDWGNARGGDNFPSKNNKQPFNMQKSYFSANR